MQSPMQIEVNVADIMAGTFGVPQLWSSTKNDLHIKVGIPRVEEHSLMWALYKKLRLPIPAGILPATCFNGSALA